MAEFDLIAALLDELGTAVEGEQVIIGPGDDCAATRVPAARDLVSSIDSLVAGVHFPAAAPAELVGFRSMCVSFSDVAAMGAEPAFAIIALTLPEQDERWLRGFARGVALAARRFGCAVVGGNLARGPLNVAVSAHGHLTADAALRRDGASSGELACVAGPIGVAALALDRDDLVSPGPLKELLEFDASDQRYPLRRYYAPEPDFALARDLRAVASAAIDLSDGLLADLGHLCAASAVGLELDTTTIPHPPAVSVHKALACGDDYLLCFALAEQHLEELRERHSSVVAIGRFSSPQGIRDQGGAILSGRAGFDHFADD